MAMMNEMEYRTIGSALAGGYRAAVYCRLSKDDDLQGESASIANQRDMLEKYCEKQGWEVVAVYQDDGFTGLNMERPDLQRMLRAIERRQINLVITKDLSRLGRNYLQTGHLIEDFFPRNGVRYIAMNDGIDTLRDNNDIAPFKNILNKLFDYPKLRNLLYALLFMGKSIPYNPLEPSTEIAEILGFVKNIDGNVVVANRIFESLLYNLFLAEESIESKIYDVGSQEKNQFIINGHLNMRLVLEKFVLHFNEIYGGSKDSFLEETGRRYFLLYLKPIINGSGNYYIEAETRNRERTDIIVDYHGEQFIIEMKLWRGNAYHIRGEEQLCEYLDYYHTDQGYMISFCFNKDKKIGVYEIELQDKKLIEAIV